MLRADLHIHTRFSPDSATSPEKLVARCLQRGLNCIAITDHNTIRGALEVQKLAPFTVIIGEEVKTSEGELTGLFLKEEIPAGLSHMETAQRIKDQGGLVSIPHPFDRLRRSVIMPAALEEVLPLADIIEVFNSRNTFSKANRMALEVAQANGLAASAVSDAHSLMEVGRTYISMPEFDGTAQGFLASLRQGSLVTHRSSPLVHLVTTYQKIKDRLLGRTSSGKLL